MMVYGFIVRKDGADQWIVFCTIYWSHCERGWGDLRDISLKKRVTA
ncbi:hypothetical protein [Bartonella sp. TT121SHDZB]